MASWFVDDPVFLAERELQKAVDEFDSSCRRTLVETVAKSKVIVTERKQVMLQFAMPV